MVFQLVSDVWKKQLGIRENVMKGRFDRFLFGPVMSLPLGSNHPREYRIAKIVESRQGPVIGDRVRLS